MHNLVLEDPRKMHAHTFRVGMYVIEKQDENPVFFNNEKILKEYFDRYKGIRINELLAFKDIVPTLENMGMIFYRDLKRLLPRMAWSFCHWKSVTVPYLCFVSEKALS